MTWCSSICGRDGGTDKLFWKGNLMSEIVIVNATEVRVDGQVQMTGEALKNPGTANAIIKAYLRWLEQVLADKDAACKAQIDEASARAQAAEQRAADAEAKAASVTEDCDRRQEEARKAVAAIAEEANAKIAAALKRATDAETRENLHWQLSQAVMGQGTTEAAVAAVREIDRINTLAERARLDAKLAAQS